MTTLTKLILALSLVLCITRIARAEGTFSDHYDRAQLLIENDQYGEALKELELAYGTRQLPKVLYEIGQVHRKLGNAREALGYYRRYLTADTQIEPAVRAEVEGEIALLSKIVGEPQPAAPAVDQRYELVPGTRLVPVHYEMRSNRGMLAAGITLLTTGYAAALISGSIFATFGGSSYDNQNGNLAAAGGTLIIPVVGPLISSLVYRTTYWSLPWTLVDGGAQIAGLALIIAGARMKHQVPVLGERFSIAPYGGSDGGGLIARGRF